MVGISINPTVPLLCKWGQPKTVIHVPILTDHSQ